MSEIISIAGSSSSSYSHQILDVVSGSPTINGSSNTVQSSASGIGIMLTGGNNAISITGSSDTLVAGNFATGGVSGDTLILTGNYNTIEDDGFGNGGVTIDGSYNNFSSQQRIETSNIVVNGNNDTVSATYMNGNFVINGDNALVFANNGNFTVNGANDTVIAANAQTILVTGDNAKVVDEAAPGSSLPTALLAGADAASQDSTPGTAISITGSGASVTTYNNNNTVSSSGDNSSVSLQSFGNSATVAGSNSNVSAQSSAESISVGGAHDTVSTSTSLLSGKASSTVPASTVTVDSVVASTTTYNAGGSTTIVDTTPGAGASTVNITSGGTSVVATAGGTYNDSVGHNAYTIGGGTKLDLSSGDNTVTVQDGEMLTQDTLGGSAGALNTVVIGSGSVVNLTASGVTAGYDILSVTGSGSSGFIYGAPGNALYLDGSNNIFAILPNPSVSGGAGSEISVSGADTLSIWSGNNSIQAGGGATLFVVAGGNTITGGNMDLTLQGNGNSVNLTGNATVSDASPWNYGMGVATTPVQNAFTVQGGQFSLGGEDTLLQTGSSAALTLAGGNSVTLNGSNDNITANDQVYGGNNIVLNGANDSVNVVNVSDGAATIHANAGAFVTATDDTGFKIGGTNTNSNEKLMFIGGTGTSSTVMAAGSNAQVTLFGGLSSNNIVSGGKAGNNNLDGGLGGGDLFRAGGNNDVLTGGSSGANTLVSAAGNETLTGAGLGNDLFSITGGGGTDMITNFTGSLVVASNLSVTNETEAGGALNVFLNDGTHLIFANLASVSQSGNLFTH